MQQKNSGKELEVIENYLTIGGRRRGRFWNNLIDWFKSNKN